MGPMFHHDASTWALMHLGPPSHFTSSHTPKMVDYEIIFGFDVKDIILVLNPNMMILPF